MTQRTDKQPCLKPPAHKGVLLSNPPQYRCDREGCNQTWPIDSEPPTCSVSNERPLPTTSGDEELVRYELVVNGDNDILPHPDGEYVKYADYAKAIAAAKAEER